MAEHFGFFDAVQDVNGNYDREYNAEQFTIPFDALVTNGVVRSAYEQLEVVTSGTNMVSRVKSGIAFIEGHHYLNDGIIELTHDVEVLGLSRIDRVIIRKDSSPETRYVKAFIRKGVPSANPVPPTLTRNEYIYEISLAQIRVVGGQGFINAVTDERGTEDIGPWAGSDILPSYDDNLLAQHVLNDNLHLQTGERQRIANAVQKTGDTMTGDLVIKKSVPSIKIEMPNNAYNAEIKLNANEVADYGLDFYKNNTIYLQVKGQKDVRFYGHDNVWTSLQDLKLSVSNGKAAIANAVTQKGVPTAIDAEFATMAANILKLTGFATGTRTVAQDGSLSVTGLTFEPKVVIAVIGSGTSAGHMYIERLSTAAGYIVEAFDASNQPNEPPTVFSPVWAKRKTDSNVIFTPTSFSIPAKSAGTYTWYAYG